MNAIFEMEWLGSALLGATIAALGYVLKLLIELFQSSQDKKRQRRSSLIELRSLLRASRVGFQIQQDHAKTLVDLIQGDENVEELAGYEAKISTAYASLNKEEKELHGLIRSLTINTLRPTNKSILAWLKRDMYFKAQKNEMANQLAILESHLILWLAKYEAWIPQNPEHALIYMADENKHGVGFPKKIDELIEDETNFR